jgi:hypothetical protein
MLAPDEMTEPLPNSRTGADPEDEAIALLVSRAIARGDRTLARDLAALPRSDEAEYALVEAACPALARIAAVCDPIETLAWRRALVDAGVRGDRRRARALMDLAARRCSD